MSKFGIVSALMIGAAVGSAVTMMVDPIDDKRKRKMRKNITSVTKTVGTVMDAIACSCR